MNLIIGGPFKYNILVIFLSVFDSFETVMLKALATVLQRLLGKNHGYFRSCLCDSVNDSHPGLTLLMAQFMQQQKGWFCVSIQ